MTKIIVDDLQALLDSLPPHVLRPLQERGDLGDLIEVVLDLGRPPEARFPASEAVLDSQEVREEDLQYVIHRVGAFGDDNRAGIERTLHRFSAMRNRRGRVVGITCRVGRAVYGIIQPLEDLIRSEKSILLLGRPGVGKTTILREAARVLADDAGKRVVVVDTSNEIAGDGDIPHPGIGRARRMQVPTPALQHHVMIEAVENHMPQVIIIDEMGTEQEAEAARTIAERGVQLIATAHGNTLENLILNPTLSDLIGGVQTVILGDDEARRRRTQKTVQERKRPPTFDIVVEIRDREHLAVHLDVAKVVDDMLRGAPPNPELRWVDGEGRVHKAREAKLPAKRQHERPSYDRPQYDRYDGALYRSEPEEEETGEAEAQRQSIRLFPFGVSRGAIEHAIQLTRSPVELVDNVDDAQVLVTTKAHYRRGPQVLRTAEARGKLVHVLRNNNPPQIAQFVRGLAYRNGASGALDTALQEAQDAVERVWQGEEMVELSPQRSYVRRLQHQLAHRYNLQSTSVGEEPDRRLNIYRSPMAR
ncbi:MAG: AAA family ATPase [Chloroflexi bacterium]|nr:AAA family ATPase [Chloroflexota bacterium]